ncbi:MAG TPA: cytochrome P450, partial [Anaerolineales bacterium]
MTTALAENLERKIHGPMPAPVLGWLPWLFRFAMDPLASLENMRRQYGDILRLGFKNYPVVMIFHPEYNRQILRDPSRFYSYNLDLLPISFPRDSSIKRATTGMPLMNGPRHTDHRSALLPYFHKKFITRYHDSCVEVTQRKVSGWQPGMEVNLRAEMEQLAMWLAT